MTCSIRVVPKFSAKGLFCAVSNSRAGNMSLTYADTKDSLANRKNFLKGQGIDYKNLVCAKQAHGNNVYYARETDCGSGALNYDSAIADSDGFVTDRKNVPLAIFTADCLSLFLYDPKRPAIGLAHAGWRSTLLNIAAKAIRLMQKEFSTQPENLSVGFGPGIQKCCYAVECDLQEAFPEALSKRDNRYYLDLAQVNKKQILDSGVNPQNIFDAGMCTYCRSDEFFSFRRQGKDAGRMMSVVMLIGG